jgi:hypothetical protein
MSFSSASLQNHKSEAEAEAWWGWQCHLLSVLKYMYDKFAGCATFLLEESFLCIKDQWMTATTTTTAAALQQQEENGTLPK